MIEADLFKKPRKNLILIAGPCVIEDADLTDHIAAKLAELRDETAMPVVFKASYDKANRTALDSFRGPGLEKGLQTLADIKSKYGLPLISDVHRVSEVDAASQVLDIIQIPAFLCRQTDLLIKVACTHKPINVKKGQFLAPWDMTNVVTKIKSTGNHRVLLTERGAMFGYNNLVVDFRGLQIMRETGCPVIFDATHSVQLPGGSGTSSGGQRRFAPVLARSAVAAGADGVFLEVHPAPENARCDGPNSLRLDDLTPLIKQLEKIHRIVVSGGDEPTQ